MSHSTQNKPLSILLADDDKSDRYFFEKALKTLDLSTRLTTVEDGEKLMTYLSENSEKLPDVLFLDLNMPRKNGAECLLEIKANSKLKQLPVIIYSTSISENVTDIFYETGAHYYMHKRDFKELAETLDRLLNLMVETNFTRPSNNNFVQPERRNGRMI